MKKPRIVLFYSRKKDEAVGAALRRKFDLIPFSIDDPLDKHLLPEHVSLVILYDSSEKEQGAPQLTAIRKVYPGAPLFLVADDPSKHYLTTALRCKVDRLLNLPLDPQELVQVVETQIGATPRQPFGKRLRQGWSALKQQIQALFVREEKPDPVPPPEAPPVEIMGIAPPRFLKLLAKHAEQEHHFDMSVQFFGELKIKIHGKTVPNIKGKKNASVLAYLLFHHHKSVHRDVLIDRFWSEVSTASARNSLNVAICSIRKDLAKAVKDQEVILYDRESYCINPQLEIITDVEKFVYYWKKGRAIEASQGLHNALHAYNKAVALCREEFLENLRFEDWCESERANLREIYLFILNRLSTYFFEEQNYYGCINICKKMLSTDPCLEEVYRKLMKCYYALGLTDMAYKQYFKCKKVLEEELELEPSRPTEDLFAGMQQGMVI